MEVCVYAFEVGQGYFFAEDHFVETWDEEGVEEAAVEDGHADYSADEFEVGEMFGIDVGGGVDLEGVAVHCGVCEEAVGGVEHLV